MRGIVTQTVPQVLQTLLITPLRDAQSDPRASFDT
jgi:hypothetical protein